MRFIILLILICFNLNCNAGDIKYKIEDIPAELKQNSKLVIRNKEYKFTVMSVDKAILEVKIAISVLNDNGIEDSKIVLGYGKFSRVTDFKQTIYDEFGKKVNIPEYNKVMDICAISGYSLYEDNRVKYFDPQQKTPPFTVEYTYSIVFDGLFDYPQWQLYEDFNVSIEKTKFEVIVPEGMDLRYYSNYKQLNPEITSIEKEKSYIWDTSMIKSIIEEPFGLPLSEYTPVVYIAPNDFKISSYRGNMQSWQNFGKWIELLNEGRDSIPLETQKKLLSMVSNISDTFERVKMVYQYMQNQTRYVSIQIGIGGWQPFDAETVDRLGYGDCKALSNYTKALLKVVGIEAFYTLVMAGRDAPHLIKDFPSSQFNHVILFVPMQKDTVWLECTSQYIPYGYLGTFTDDRDVLVIDKDSSRILHTLRYDKQENTKVSCAEVYIYPDGNGKANIITKYCGEFYDEIENILRSDNETKKDRIYNNIQIPDFNITSFNYEENKSIIPEVKEIIQVDLMNYGKLLGGNILLDLNLINSLESIPSNLQERYSDIYIRRPKVFIDTIRYHIPADLTLKSRPSEVNEISEFGNYHSKIEFSGEALIYTRRFELFPGVYSKDKYNQFISFIQKVHLFDKSKVVFSKS